MDAFLRELLARLEREQQLGSERAEARWMGVSAALWSRVQRGEVKTSQSLIAGALERYPDLVAHVPQNMRLRKARQRVRRRMLQVVA